MIHIHVQWKPFSKIAVNEYVPGTILYYCSLNSDQLLHREILEICPFPRDGGQEEQPEAHFILIRCFSRRGD